MRRLWWVLLLLLAAAPASAEEAAHVASVVDGDTVVLKVALKGATTIRLVGIQAPKLALGRKNFPAWPLAEASKSMLESLVMGKTLGLSFGGTEKDRHGRLLAHLYVKGGHLNGGGPNSGRWVQGEMLKAGMARVYSFADNRARVAEMLALEKNARDARRGIWGLGYYAVRRPEELAALIGTFQLVRGRVLRAARVKGRVYLNFGDDWRQDFTVTVDSRARRMFKKAGVDPLAFEGREVRVRGWLKKWNGPMIDATHPEQIEVLTRGPGGTGVSPDNETRRSPDRDKK